MVSVGIFAFGLLLAGTITLAYFMSRDEVSNFFHSEPKSVEIELFEPEWFKTGAEDAKKLVPGMTIAKDPYVVNVSDTDVYIRMKVDVVDYKDKIISAGDDRYKMIMKLLCLSGDDSFADLKEPQNYEANSIKHLVDFENGEVSKSNNKNFEYDNGWFYYIDADSKAMKLRKTGQATERLFEEIHIPILKKDYLNNNYYNDENYDIFQYGFTIRIVAQAVPASDLEDKDKSFIKNVFSDSNASSYEIYKTSSDGKIN